VALTVTLAFAGYTQHAFAEGTDDLNAYQGLFEDTEMFVDIDDAANEEICWTGQGSITVTNTEGDSIGSVSSGHCGTCQ